MVWNQGHVHTRWLLESFRAFKENNRRPKKKGRQTATNWHCRCYHHPPPPNYPTTQQQQQQQQQQKQQKHQQKQQQKKKQQQQQKKKKKKTREGTFHGSAGEIGGQNNDCNHQFAARQLILPGNAARYPGGWIAFTFARGPSEASHGLSGLSILVPP